MEKQIVTGEPVEDPRELAAAIAGIVRDGTRWNQYVYFSTRWFVGEDGRLDFEKTVDVADARATLGGCGATACVAGWAAILHAPVGSLIDYQDRLTLPGEPRRIQARTYGQEALDISYHQADWLFSEQRTEDEVLTVLDAIAEGLEWEVPEEER